MPPVVKSMFALIKPVIDSSQRRYRAAKENGSKGGRPRKNQTENQTINQTGNQEKDTDIDSDNDMDFDSEKDADIDGERESLSGGGETICTRSPYKQPSEQDFEKMRQAAQERLLASTQKR